jgi:hypothetical protein
MQRNKLNYEFYPLCINIIYFVFPRQRRGYFGFGPGSLKPPPPSQDTFCPEATANVQIWPKFDLEVNVRVNYLHVLTYHEKYKVNCHYIFKVHIFFFNFGTSHGSGENNF